jgi:hypothetical protein
MSVRSLLGTVYSVEGEVHYAADATVHAGEHAGLERFNCEGGGGSGGYIVMAVSSVIAIGVTISNLYKLYQAPP